MTGKIKKKGSPGKKKTRDFFMCRFVFATTVKTSEYGKALEKGKTIKCAVTKLFFPITLSGWRNVHLRMWQRKGQWKINACKENQCGFSLSLGKAPSQSSDGPLSWEQK